MANDRGYLGNIKLKKSGTPIDWTPEMVDEWIKCRDDPIYFTEKYIKIINLNDGLVNFLPYDYQKQIIQTIHDERFTIVLTGRQSGKALALDEKIPTPNGFKLMGELVPGDVIFDNNGQKTKVTFATDVMYNHNCYDMTFDNGEIIKCDADHLWVVEVKNKQTTKTTEELIPILEKAKKKKQAVRIRGHNGVEYPHRTDLTIDPYMFGYWLGDGTRSSGRFTIADYNYDFIKAKFESYGYEVQDFKRDNRVEYGGYFDINGFITTLKSENLYMNKHIPEKYMLSSKQQRIQLIQGLMDSDGSVDKGGSCEFYNKNQSIIDSFRIVLSSLGVKSTKRIKIINEEVHYTVSFTTDKFAPVTLPQKVSRILSAKERNSRPTYNDCFFIRSIDRCESVPVRCIKVDAPDSMFLASESFIPTHNTTSLISSVLHYVIFNDDKTAAILANKGDTAREILGRIQLAYENLPKWMQHGVKEYNKGSMELENNSRILAAATSSAAIRGYSISFLFIDECAFVEGWEEFYKSVYPTISSGKDSKVVLVSTPNGLNHYYKLWMDAVESKSSFIPIKVTWKDVPGRDERWKEETISNTSPEAFIQEHEAEFVGSSGTLIEGKYLKTLVEWMPIKANKYLRIYDNPVPEKQYVIIADVSRGKGIDNSAFSVVDVSSLPYKVVATYYCDSIPPDMYAEVIYQAYKFYNDAFVLVENNDAGCETLRVLHDVYECETVLGTINNGLTGERKRISINGGQGFEFGIRTTKSTKAIGCSRIKTMVENGTIEFGDKHIIHEINRFVRKGSSYEAEPGEHDDIMMTLVMFGWLTTQDLFTDLTNIDTRYKIREKFEDRFEEELVPFGYILDGTEENIMELEMHFSRIQVPDYSDEEYIMDLLGDRDNTKDFLGLP